MLQFNAVLFFTYLKYLLQKESTININQTQLVVSASLKCLFDSNLNRGMC